VWANSHSATRSGPVALRRPAEAIIAYVTLAAWSLLLLALPLLRPDGVRMAAGSGSR
jgi:hypothetical protein